MSVFVVVADHDDHHGHHHTALMLIADHLCAFVCVIRGVFVNVRVRARWHAVSGANANVCVYLCLFVLHKIKWVVPALLSIRIHLSLSWV